MRRRRYTFKMHLPKLQKRFKKPFRLIGKHTKVSHMNGKNASENNGEILYASHDCAKTMQTAGFIVLWLSA